MLIIMTKVANNRHICPIYGEIKSLKIGIIVDIVWVSV